MIFEFDAKDLVYVRIDHHEEITGYNFTYGVGLKRTAVERARLLENAEVIPADQAAGMSAEEIFDYFYGKVTFTAVKEGWSVPFDENAYRGSRLGKDLIDAKSGKVMAEEGTRMTPE